MPNAIEILKRDILENCEGHEKFFEMIRSTKTFKEADHAFIYEGDKEFSEMATLLRLHNIPFRPFYINE